VFVSYSSTDRAAARAAAQVVAGAGLIEYLDAGGPVILVAPARRRATPARPPRRRERDRVNTPALVQPKLLLGE
jgi:hypothetical protein